MAPPAKKAAPLGDPSDPGSMGPLAERFVEWMAVRNYSDRTVEGHTEHLRRFIDWCADRGVARPENVTVRVLERYQQHVFYTRKSDGEPLAPSTQHARLMAIKMYFRWLTKQHVIDANPASELELPKVPKRLPKHVLSPDEAERVLAQPDLDDPLGVRDRAMLETLYSTGMRRMELANLKLHDVDIDRGTVMIRQGKGQKDRMVPIGERACAFIRKYVDDVRPELSCGDDDGALFLSRTGTQLGLNAISRMARDYVNAAGIHKKGARHLFRHTMATLMLEGGADIRFIQVMLGHAALSTTEIYTQVAIKKLKEIHTATHPAARLRERRRDDDDDDETESASSASSDGAATMNDEVSR